MKFSFNLFLLFILVSCLPNPSNRGSVKLGSDANLGIENSSFKPVDNSIKIERVQVYNNQLYIQGQNLDQVKTVQVNGQGLDDRMVIEAQEARQIIANASKQISFLIDKTFNLILNTANASATFQIFFDFTDKSITAIKLNNMGANDGDVLRWNDTRDTWEPADLNNLSFGGTWDANLGQLTTGGTDISTLSPMNGTYYVVNVAGSFNLSGITDWKIGDWAIYRDDCCWEKIVNSNEVTSVFGKKGVVTFGINELDDVDIVTNAPTDGQALIWDNAGTKWVPGSVVSGDAGSIDTSNIADGAVTSSKIADNSITTAKLQDNSVTSSKIVDGTITTVDLAAGFGLDANQVASGSCTVSNASFCELEGLVLGGGNLNDELQKFLKRDGSVVMTNDLDLGGNSLLNVGGYSLAGGFTANNTDSDATAGSSGGSDVTITIKDDTDGKTFGADTLGRMLRFHRTDPGDQIYTYDIGLDIENEFTIFNRDGTSAALKIDSSGYLGIGNADPQVPVHINGNGAIMRLEGTDHSFMEFYPDGSATRKALFGFKAAPDDLITLENEAATNGHISVIPGPMAYVGINDTTPEQMLHVNSSADKTAVIIESENADGDAFIEFRNSDPGPIVDQSWYLGLDEGDSNKLKIQAGSSGWDPSTAQVSFDIDGNVGIGTMSPDSIFHIKPSDYTSNTDGRSALSLETTDQFDDMGVSFRNNDGQHAWSIFKAFTGDDSSTFTGDLVFAGGTPDADPANLIENVRFTSDGKIGVGTSTPIQDIHLYKTASSGVELLLDTPGSDPSQSTRLSFITDGGNGAKPVSDATVKGWSLIARANSYSVADDINDLSFYFYDSGTPTKHFTIAHDTGNVGIGVDVPTEKLHVDGTVVATNFQTTTGMADFDEVQINDNTITTNTEVATDRDLVLTSNGNGVVEISKEDLSSSVTNVLTVSHTNSGGSGASGIGVSMDFATQDDAGNPESVAMIEAVLTDASDGAEIGDLNFKTNNAGTLSTAMTIKGSGDITLDNDTLFVDSANNRVGLGVNTPELKLDLGPSATLGGQSLDVSDHWYVTVDASQTLLTAGGAEDGLLLRVGASGPESYGGQTYVTGLKIMPTGNVSVGDSVPEAKLDIRGNAIIGDDSSVGEVHLRTDNATNFIGLRAPTALASDTIFTLPSVDGSSGNILVTDGAGNLSFTGSPNITETRDIDLDTSINLETNPDEDKIRFNTAGSERMIIDENGMVGIGITSPSSTIEIRPSDYVTDTDGRATIALQTTDNLDDLGLTYKNNDNTYVWSIFKEFTGDNATTFTGDLVFAGGDTVATPDLLVERMRLSSSGFLGLGTSTPVENLHVYQTADDDSELIIDTSGVQANQVSALTLMTKGDGAKQVEDAATQGWSFVAHGDVFTTANYQHDLHIQFDNLGTLSKLVSIEHDTGNVGIGTDAPVQKLHVSGNAYVNDNIGVGITAPTERLHILSNGVDEGLKIEGTGAFTDGSVKLTLDGARSAVDSVNSMIDFDIQGNDGARISSLQTTTNSSVDGSHLAFSTSVDSASLTERMRILNSGEIGIGASTPTSMLHIYDSNNTDSLDVNPGLVIESSRNADSPVTLMLRNSATSPDDDPVFITMGISDSGDEGAAGTTGEKAWKIGNIANNTARFSIGFDTGDIDDIDAGVTEGLIILDNGNVGIPGGDTFNNFSPSYNLHVIGPAGLSTGTAWTNASDERLKDIRAKYTKGIDQIMGLEPVVFNYKKDNPVGLPSDPEIVGFVAQSVQKVIPEAVSEDKNGFLQLNVDPIHWAHINATKQQQGEIEQNLKMLKVMQGAWEEMERRVASLEEENQRLKEENLKLKARLDKIEEILNIQN